MRFARTLIIIYHNTYCALSMHLFGLSDSGDGDPCELCEIVVNALARETGIGSRFNSNIMGEMHRRGGRMM